MYMSNTYSLLTQPEMLDLIHRIYEADESFRSLDFHGPYQALFLAIVLQIILGTLYPHTAVHHAGLEEQPQRNGSQAIYTIADR